jgi:hypothetical protein
VSLATAASAKKTHHDGLINYLKSLIMRHLWPKAGNSPSKVETTDLTEVTRRKRKKDETDTKAGSASVWPMQLCPTA